MRFAFDDQDQGKRARGNGANKVRAPTCWCKYSVTAHAIASPSYVLVPSDFIKKYQGKRSRVFQNMTGFCHFNHER